jgi:hypothetical protein
VTGFRSSETKSLRFSECDLERNIVTLGDSKTGVNVRPLSDIAIEIIKRQKRSPQDEYVFAYRHEKPIYSLRTYWLKLGMAKDVIVKFLAEVEPCAIGMEACGSAHCWARRFRTMGHEVKLTPPIYVKPYVERGKNDAADAAAICEAMSRPNMRFVAVKSEDQQATLMAHKTRELLIKQRTMSVNASRGHLAEFGVIAAKGTSTSRNSSRETREKGSAPCVLSRTRSDDNSALWPIRWRSLAQWTPSCSRKPPRLRDRERRHASRPLKYRGQQNSPCRVSSSTSWPIVSAFAEESPAHYPILKNSLASPTRL